MNENTNNGCPLTNSITTQCRLTSIGFGTGKSLFDNASMYANSLVAEIRDKYSQPAL